MSASLPPDFVDVFASLTPAQQVQVRNYIHELQADLASHRAHRRSALLELAGSISHEDAEIMRKVIEEECERVDDGS